MGDPRLILYPSVAMFLLTFVVVLHLGLSRYLAIQRREVGIKYYRLFNEGTQPERLELLSRHVRNHFEAPPLFHIGVLMAFATGAVEPVIVALAWSYVLLRCLHTWIHLGTNNVSHRFFVFGASGFVLAGIWASLLFFLIRTP